MRNATKWRLVQSIGGALLAACAALPAHSGEADWERTVARLRALELEGKYEEAVSLAEQAAKQLEGGPGDTSGQLRVATLLTLQAVAYSAQYKSAKAEELAQRGLTMREAVLPPDDLAIAESRDLLGGIYVDKGLPEKGGALIRQALEVRERLLGREHLDTVQSLHSLGTFYAAQGLLDEARPFFERALAVREKVLSREDPRVAQSLNALGVVHAAQGRPREAEPLLRRAFLIRKHRRPPKDLAVAQSASTLGSVLVRIGRERYAEAEPLLRQALGILEERLGGSHAWLGEPLEDLATIYFHQERYAEAEPLLQRLISVSEGLPPPNAMAVAHSAGALASLYLAQHRYREAQTFLQRAEDAVEKVLGPEHPEVAAWLNDLAAVYVTQLRYREAEPLMQRALRIVEQAPTPDEQDLARSLTNLGNLYARLRRPAEAETLLRRAVAIRERVPSPSAAAARSEVLLGAACLMQRKYDEAEAFLQRGFTGFSSAARPGDTELATTQVFLASLYMERGRYAQADTLLTTALATLRKALQPDDPLLALGLVTSAALRVVQGMYGEADSLFGESIPALEKALSADHLELATPLMTLAGLREAQGRYEEAERLVRRAITILATQLSPEHPDLALPLNNLGVILMDQGRREEAESQLSRAVSILEKEARPTDPDLGLVLNTLGALYVAQARYVEAEPVVRRALAIRHMALPPGHPDIAQSLSNLADLLLERGRYATAEELFQQALTIRAASLGPDHPQVGSSLMGLALTYYRAGRVSDAAAAFDRSFSILANEVRAHFDYMTERQKLKLLGRVAAHTAIYLSFCLKNTDNAPGLIEGMYDRVLWQKALVGRDTLRIRRHITATGDRESVALLGRLASIRSQIANLLAPNLLAPPSAEDHARRRDLASRLESDAEELEAQLAGRSKLVGPDKALADTGWQDVRAALQPGDAAAEFVSFRFHDGSLWTPTLYNIALVLTPSLAAPRLVVLSREPDAEREAFEDYRVLVRISFQTDARAEPGGKRFADTFWRPLEAEIGKASRIYLAPDGLLNLVAWDVVPTADGSRLVDKHDIRVVPSTRELVRAKRSESRSRTAVLLADPRLQVDEKAAKGAAMEARAVVPPPSEAVPFGPRPQQAGTEAPPGRDWDLAWTRTQVEQLRPLLIGRGWRVSVYEGPRASEEAVKSVAGPRVLHLATHGFFRAEQDAPADPFEPFAMTYAEDPLLRSGVLLAGARDAASVTLLAPGREDGILTAYEAMGLNLQGTDLVVLSACDTGLGVVRNGEGVLGLARALRVAGADAVLLSMWRAVPLETAELLELFYRNWLAGLGKHEALRRAKQEMRRIARRRQDGYDAPGLWGGFVLIGGN